MKPVIHPSVFVADGAQIWGDVEIGANSSVWFGAVIRGDEGKVIIGEETNIQDNCVLHSDLSQSVVIGNRVTIGHGCIIRACQIDDNTMIGMNSTVMSGVVIGKNSVVGAHSLITYNEKFDDYSLILGVPAKRLRDATPEERQFSQIAGSVYKKLILDYNSRRIEQFEES